MGLFGGNRGNGYRPTRSTPLTKVHPSGRRVYRAKISAAYTPPPKDDREAVRRDRQRERERYLQGREERRQDRKGGWGLFSK